MEITGWGAFDEVVHLESGEKINIEFEAEHSMDAVVAVLLSLSEAHSTEDDIFMRVIKQNRELRARVMEVDSLQETVVEQALRIRELEKQLKERKAK